MITVGEILVDPSVVATVPTLVSSDDLDSANSRITAVEVVTNEFVGAPVGAVSFAVVPWLPFLLDAVSYLGSIAPFSRLPPTSTRQRENSTRPPIRVEMGEGLRWIRDHPFLRPLTLGIAVFHSGTAGAFSLLVLFVTDVLEASEITFGIVLAASAIGATFATLVAPRLVDRSSRRTVITGAAVLSAVSVLAVGGVTTEWQLVIVWALNGASGGVLLSIGRGFIQRHTPRDRLGRTAIASRMILLRCRRTSLRGHRRGDIDPLVVRRGWFASPSGFDDALAIVQARTRVTAVDRVAAYDASHTRSVGIEAAKLVVD
ncbi:MAG: MFS transporter [Actinobacteria bacterium]|nr:MFS transporter [Actinomycetota bacterium]